jgi:glycosyltransferase involved in cell wall biosynthesis
MLIVAHVFERAGEFDLIHNQADFPAHAFSRSGRHAGGDDDPRLLLGPHPADVQALSGPRPLCRDQRGRPAPRFRYAATIHHGIRLRNFPSRRMAAKTCSSSAASTPTRAPPRRSPRRARRPAAGHGRHHPGSGLFHAKSRLRSTIAASITAPSAARSAAPLGSARALLHLINFDEPFGLSVVEALACGTPVIAIDRGSMPELITPETGFLVESTGAAITALGQIESIDRAACRARVAAHFSVGAMAENYIALYRRILAKA